ncbi:hypothetical protein U1295_07950 [Enterococcus cecorum]|uniref:hypothetical protein n=1 Tax=Enterococcus cecorum TaxID=44008 RepID=UPI000760E785|nr:hypothetical protein [Enterococcus cecorum]MDZ5547021.1 hypothetical protein [Enterococcus cecorum]MDZ5575943.1 hypothetical protein [Enterococcus cecorum]MDZ5582191.1 hypothetical protein [Enterococcus cecorum]MDZ5592945.1 hypothetical protein [Enterococcus cecorum]CAI3341100.1 hypothetical protein CIRMBP1312_00406 [Enterococcus cecorum]
MEKTIQTLKLDNKELIEELKEIHEKNADIYRMLFIDVNYFKRIDEVMDGLSENNRKLIKVITILEYLEELEK